MGRASTELWLPSPLYLACLAFEAPGNEVRTTGNAPCLTQLTSPPPSSTPATHHNNSWAKQNIVDQMSRAIEDDIYDCDQCIQYREAKGEALVTRVFSTEELRARPSCTRSHHLLPGTKHQLAGNLPDW